MLNTIIWVIKVQFYFLKVNYTCFESFYKYSLILIKCKWIWEHTIVSIDKLGEKSVILTVNQTLSLSACKDISAGKLTLILGFLGSGSTSVFLETKILPWKDSFPRRMEDVDLISPISTSRVIWLSEKMSGQLFPSASTPNGNDP